MSSDPEAPPPSSEASPLLPSDASASASLPSSAAHSRDSSLNSELNDLKNELEQPWPATFDRGIQILAGPIMDEKSIDGFTKSPVVRARYLKKNKNQGYYTPEASSALKTPSTPAWLKRGLVKMKSLDYRFSDQNTAILVPKKKSKTTDRHQQKIDAAAYRQKILSQRLSSGMRSSSGAVPVDVMELEGSLSERVGENGALMMMNKGDVTKSPGFQREKQMDKQRKKEKLQEEIGKEDGDEHKSSFLQCAFNMANILMGVGMLGLPYVFKSAGWIGGFCVTFALCLVTWRTSYYIGRELNGDPRPLHLFENIPLKSPSNGHSDPTIITRMRKPITGFPGIAREALGDAGSIILSSVLYFELFSCLSIFFVSLGDHLHLLFPSVSEARHMTIVAGLLIIPSALLRTPKLLSYLSMVGTISTVLVVSAVVLSALVAFVNTAETKGIFHAGGDREYILYNPDGLSLALGLVAYCFSGHAVVPSIYQSMKRPQDFEKMIDVTYIVVLFSCLLVAVSGYYMFGDEVEDQITVSLGQQSASSGSIFMTGLTWLMIMTSISKFTLTMFPLALGFEEMLTGILPSDLAMEMVDSLVKICLIFSSLAVAVFFPSFSFLCSLVGLICTMIVSVIFPTVAHLKLFGSQLTFVEKAIDWALIVAGTVVAVVGTVATIE